MSVQSEALTMVIEGLPEGYAAFSRGDPERAMAGMDAEIELVVPENFPAGGSYHGHAGVRRFWETAWREFESWRLVPERFVPVPPDKVLVFVTETIKGRASQADSTVHTFHLWTMDGPLATRMEVFFDFDEARQAAGLEGDAV
jgi:ketosteroid isomerase-like protein